MTPGTHASVSTNSAPSTSNAATGKGPWQGPELTKSPEYVLDTLRETQHMINSLQERAKKLKAEVNAMYQSGDMAHLVDDENSQKYNGTGVSVTLCAGKSTRVWDSAVQMEIDKIQAEMDRVKLKAESARLFTDKEGPKYWRVNLAKEL
jgi:hypothetical protein